MGERLSTPLLAAALNELGIPSVPVSAVDVIVTDPHHGRAEPLMDATRVRAEERLRPLLKKGIVPVVTGFIAATLDGVPTTLGRGGSDYSATILGAALGAQETVIWTDVDGVKTADPRIVPEARTIDEISYNEAAELAYFGAEGAASQHPAAGNRRGRAGVDPQQLHAGKAGHQDHRARQLQRRRRKGAHRDSRRHHDHRRRAGHRGATGRAGEVVRGDGGPENERAAVSQSSSQNDICFVISSTDEKRTVEALRDAFAPEIAEQTVEHVSSNSGIAIVAVVGENMQGIPGIAGRTFSALGREGISIIAIAQGSSEYNISLVVDAAAMQRAMLTLHKEFRLHEPASGTPPSSVENHAAEGAARTGASLLK